jgi:metal-responsive CopG/Arc/MetJ family transcriptional regulator
MSHYSYPLNDERERLLDRLEAETDANTRAEAVDAAIRHYLEDKQNREEHWEEFEPGKLKLLNTSELKMAYFPKVR